MVPVPVADTPCLLRWSPRFPKSLGWGLKEKHRGTSGRCRTGPGNVAKRDLAHVCYRPCLACAPGPGANLEAGWAPKGQAAVSCSDVSPRSLPVSSCQILPVILYAFWEQGTVWEVLNWAITSFPVDLKKYEKTFTISLPVTLTFEFQLYGNVIILRNSNRTFQLAKLWISEFWRLV